MFVKSSRRNRSANIIAEYGNIVLYHALEGNKVIQSFMVRPANKFWEEYGQAGNAAPC